MNQNKVKMNTQLPKIRNKNFTEVELGYSKDEAKKEKLRKRIAKAFLAFILIGALIVAAVIAVFLFAFISEGF